MNRFRLRGTWEDAPAPIPFPGTVAGRQAGLAQPPAAVDVPETQLSDRTNELVESVDQGMDQLQLRFDEFKHLLESDVDEAGYDDPSAA